MSTAQLPTGQVTLRMRTGATSSAMRADTVAAAAGNYGWKALSQPPMKIAGGRSFFGNTFESDCQPDGYIPAGVADVSTKRTGEVDAGVPVVALVSIYP